MKKTPLFVWILTAGLILLTVGCGNTPNPSFDVGTQADAGGDTGTDVDADTDAEVGLCDPEPADFPPRPLWSEIEDGSGVPDYQNVMNNVNVLDSLRLFASMLSKAVGGIEALQGAADTDSTGHCICNCAGNQFNVDWAALGDDPDDIGGWAINQGTQFSLQCYIADYTREDCVQKCDAVGAPSFGSNQEINTDKNFIWAPNDVFKNPDLSPKYALKLVDFLDEVSGFLSSGGTCNVDADCDGNDAVCDAGTCKSKFRQILDNLGGAAANLTQTVQDVITALEQIEEVINRFTEGYHLGGYSSQRPDLHMCVGFGGHGAYAQLGNLGGDKVSIGARYTSHQLSYKHRAQFRTGGFGVQAFGKSLSLLPSAEANMQIHGFKLWDASKPFGVPIQAGSISTSDIHKYDIFQLIEDPAQLEDLTNGDGTIDLPGDLLVDNYYTAEYTSGADGNQYVWPRSEADAPAAWLPWTGWAGEDQSTAVFSAGLNLPLAIEPLELDLPAIDVFPPFATLQPYFRMGAGVEWIHEDFRLLARIQEKVNENIPDASLHLTDEDFERDMHDLQAPDVTEDLGTTAYVQPELGATLSAGLNLSSFLHLGMAVSLGVGVRVQPGGWGGLVDLNYTLVKALMNSNPPPEADCNAVWEPSSSESCSNTSFEDSGQTYACTDGGSSSCCITIGERKLCVEDWTGIDEDYCTLLEKIQNETENKGEKIKAWLEGLKSYVDASAVSTLITTVQNYVGNIPVSATWNQDKTCKEAKCGFNVSLVTLNSQTTCEKHGYCVDGNDNVLAHDVTKAECEAIGDGDEPLEGRCCFNYKKDRFQSIKCGVKIDQCTMQDAVFVPNGLCTQRLDPTDCTNHDDQRTDTPDNERIWVQYQCVTQVTPELTGWEGTGCHPLNQGYPSACGCQADADCAGNETCNADGVCEGDQGYACTCDPNDAGSCGAGRSCADGACFKQCASDGDCGAGLLCDGGLCKSEYDIPTAEEIVWGVHNGTAPLHAVSTYALSDLLFWAYLSFNIDLGLTIDFFFGSKEFTLFDWGKVWDLASTYKSWYQPGLEARYQHECADPAGQVVTNRQPEAVTQLPGIDLNTQGLFSGYVHRYPDPFPQSALDPDQDGNACHPTGDANSCGWDDLVEWCKPKLNESVFNPTAPTTGDLGDSFEDTFDWGQDIGLEVWASQQVCIDGQLWHEWAQNQSGAFDANMECRYENPNTGQTQIFACADVMDVLLEEWGCLSTGLNPYGPHLAAKFGASVTKNGGQTFDIDAMVIDPSQPLTIDNMNPLIRFNPGGIPFAGQKWLADVESCFDVRHADESRCECSADGDCHENLDESCNGDGFCESEPGKLSTCPVVTFAQEPEVAPCCGDGQIQGNEQCDDGNTTGGDGCSSYCTKDEGTGGETGACCNGDDCLSDTTAEKCNSVDGGVFYPGQGCEEVQCGDGEASGACCIGDSCQDGMPQSKCEANSGAFHADKMCSETKCGGSGTDRGACCVNGACVGVTTRRECDAQKGSFSVGKKCGDVSCGG